MTPATPIPGPGTNASVGRATRAPEAAAKGAFAAKLEAQLIGHDAKHHVEDRAARQPQENIQGGDAAVAKPPERASERASRRQAMATARADRGSADSPISQHSPAGEIARALAMFEVHAPQPAAAALQPATEAASPPSRRQQVKLPMSMPPLREEKEARASGPLMDNAPLPPAVKATVTRQETHFKPAGPSPVHGKLGDGNEPANAGAAVQRSSAAARLGSDAQMPAGLDLQSTGDIAATTARKFEPGTPGQISQQIFERIADADPPPAPSGETNAPETPAWIRGTAVRILSLELSPETLGGMKITLSRSDKTLSIKLEAERTDTAHAVEAGRDDLVSRLAGAGYDIGEISITRRPAETAPPQDHRRDGESGLIGGGSSTFANSGGEHEDQTDRRPRPLPGDRPEAPPLRPKPIDDAVPAVAAGPFQSRRSRIV